MPVALPELRLIGLTTITGDKRALLRIRFPAGPGRVAHEEMAWFKEQERLGSIEVLEIDVDAGAVRAAVSGTAVLAQIDAEPAHQDGSAATSASAACSTPLDALLDQAAQSVQADHRFFALA